MRYCIINIENESRYQETLDGVMEDERVFELNEETGSYDEIQLPVE